MLKIESNLKINGRHWGLQFTDGIAYTANVALAAKLLLKGYVVTDQPDQPVAGPIIAEQELSTITSSPAPADKDQTASQSEPPSIAPAEIPAPKPTKSRKKVTTDAADAG